MSKLISAYGNMRYISVRYCTNAVWRGCAGVRVGDGNHIVTGMSGNQKVTCMWQAACGRKSWRDGSGVAFNMIFIYIEVHERFQERINGGTICRDFLQ